MDSRTSLGQEAMDRVTGAAKRMAGAVTGSEDLEREGDLHREKAQSIRSAREQRERAELTEELTEAEMAQREAADERARLLAEKREQEELTRAEREADAAQDAVVDLTQRGKGAVAQDEQRAERGADQRKQAAHRQRADADNEVADIRDRASAEQKRAHALAENGAIEDGSFSERMLGRGLSAVRLPLTGVERVTGRQGSDWPPAMGFGALEATVMQVAGGLLRNEELTRKGRSKQAAVRTLKAAMAEEAEAQRRDAEAQAREQEQVEKAEQSKEQARSEAQKRTEDLERREQRKREQVEQTERRRKADARKKAQKAQEGQRNRQRTSDLADSADQQKAASRKKVAAKAGQEVLAIDEEIDANKRRRRTAK